MIAEWIAEHWELISIIAAIVLRELTKNMARQTAAQVLERLLSPHVREIRDIKRNLQLLMDHLGLEGEWSGEGLTYARVRRSLKQYCALFYRVISRKISRSRRKNMNTSNINWVTLIISLLGAAKLILQPFNIDIPDQNINEIANGAAAIISIFGIIKSHQKQEGGVTIANAQSAVSADPRK